MVDAELGHPRLAETLGARRVLDVGCGTGTLRTATLRFRTEEEVRSQLLEAGLEVVDVRNAPDRPARELVVLARRPSA